jgi:hypothetical protein
MSIVSSRINGKKENMLCPWVHVVQWAKRNEILPLSQGLSTVCLF